jgi:hypothetical protein
MHSVGSISFPSFPSDGSAKRIDNSGRGVPRRVDVVVRVRRGQHAVEGRVVEAAAIGEDAVDRVVGDLRIIFNNILQTVQKS